MAICSACGFERGNGSYCPNCGAHSGASSTQANYPPPPHVTAPIPPSPYGQLGSSVPAGYRPSKERITAALLAIFIGGLGIHKFYLGGPKQKTAGVIQIVISIFTCGIGTVIPLIEGILYLTKDDNQFEYEYVQGGKPWF